MSDVIRKLAELKQRFDPISSLRRAGSDVKRSFEAAERAVQTGLLTGDDDATIMADVVSRSFQDLFSKCSRWDETQWLSQTSYNSLVAATHAPAIADLKQDRQRFLALGDAFVGLAQLLQTKRISDNIDVKRLAKAWAPSLVLLNEIHRQDVIDRFQALARTMDLMVARIDTVLRVVDTPGSTGPAPLGFDFTRLTPGNALATRVPLLRQRTWAYPTLCRLTADVPVGTRFVVRGVHLVEKWFDVEATHLVGLKLRCTAGEGATLFTRV